MNDSQGRWKMQCTYCGKEDMLPYKCSYCEKTFCSQHRLPENHECEAIAGGKKIVKKTPPKTEKKKPTTFSYNNDDDFID